MPLVMDARFGNRLVEMSSAEVKVFVGVATMLEGACPHDIPISMIVQKTGISALWVRACLRSLADRGFITYSQTIGKYAAATISMDPNFILYIDAKSLANKAISGERKAAMNTWREICSALFR